jgi:PAS domain S-box-containing protein
MVGRVMDTKFRTIVERSIQGIVIIQDFRVVYSNQAFARISGYSKKELRSLTPTQVEKMIHPDQRALVWGRMRDRLQGQKAASRYEFKGFRKDGTIRWLEMVANRIEHEGKPAVLGAIIDITERKIAEEKLRESEERYKRIIDLAPDGIVTSDLKGVITSCNSSFLEQTGLSKNKIVGKHFSKMPGLFKSDISAYFKVIASLIKGNPVRSFEAKWKRADGRVRWGEIRVAPMKNGRKITGFQAITRDITDRRNTEKAQRESEEKFRAIFESFHDVYYRTDREGLVTIISPSVRTQAGWDPEDVIGHPVTDFYKDPSERESFKEKLKESGVINDYELKLLAKNGRVIDVSVSSKIIFGKDGKPTGVEGVLRDITDRKQAEKQVKSSLKEKEVLLQEIHHRVKNNMQIISSLLNLQSRCIEDDKVKDMYKMSRDRIKSMALIHEKLYQSEDLAKINFAQYIRSLTIHLLHTYNASTDRIKLNAEVADVFLDINKAIPCGLIVNELVSNSIKHAFPKDRKGKIHVELNTGNNGDVCLIVSDDGIGFSEKVDFQEPDSLGLQLVNDLIEQLGGTLKFDSSSGISYQIFFPI